MVEFGFFVATESGRLFLKDEVSDAIFDGGGRLEVNNVLGTGASREKVDDFFVGDG
jgi:hypothetical protein